MPDASDPVVEVQVSASGQDPNFLLVIEYIAEPDTDKKKSKQFRDWHFDRIRISYPEIRVEKGSEGQHNENENENENGKVKMFIFGLRFTVDPTDSHRVLTYSESEIRLVQRLFFDLSTTTKELGKEDWELRFDERYSFADWKKKMGDLAVATSSPRFTQKTKKNPIQKLLTKIFRRKKPTIKTLSFVPLAPPSTSQTQSSRRSSGNVEEAILPSKAAPTTKEGTSGVEGA